jgi:RimJ/RimL family protein N-acetyltransferase
LAPHHAISSAKADASSDVAEILFRPVRMMSPSTSKLQQVLVIPAVKKGINLRHFVKNIFCYRRAYIFTLSYSSQVSGSNRHSNLPPALLFRRANPEDIDSLARVAGISPQTIKRRWEAGDRCYAVFEDMRAVYMNWVHLGTCFVRGLGYYHKSPQNHAYVYGVFCHPLARGRGIYTNALRLVADDLFQGGISEIVQLVEAENKIVSGTLPRLGYIKVKEITNTRFLGARFTKVTDQICRCITREHYLLLPRGIYVI